LHSRGGSIEPAYLISKTLKRLSAKKFAVAVPRRAKSAATLLSLGADEIHVGMMSELGPIDPQFGGLPALALGNALDVVADLACRFPKASEVLTRYLAEQVPIRMLGYYQRVSDSAVQYAERLLAGKKLGDGRTPEDVAKHLVNHYKDHSFVIDYDEARTLLGQNVVKEGTPEYKAADEIFRFVDVIDIFLGFKGKEFWHVGSIEDGLSVRNKQSRS
jgi:Serine dehydrogenase proteinase